MIILKQIVFAFSSMLFFFSLGRWPFFNWRYRYVLPLSAVFSFTSLVYTLSQYRFSYYELFLLLLLLLFSLIYGKRRKYYGGSTLFQQMSHGLITVEENKSKNIRVLKRDGKTTSGIELTTQQPTSKLLWFPHLSELFPFKITRVLCIGGGACAYPIYALKMNPEMYMDVVEIDPVVVEVAKKYFPLPIASGFKLIQDNALRWLKKNHKKKYDLIFVDVGIISSVSQVSYNTQFLNENALKDYIRCLSKNGTVMINIMMTLLSGDIKLNYELLSAFNKSFRSYLAFVTNPIIDKAQLNDVLHIFSRQKVIQGLLRKKLSLTPEDQLSFNKNDYLQMLDSRQVG